MKKVVDYSQAMAYIKDDMKKKRKNPAAVALGRLGGRVTGKCKARTTEQARKAVMIRWKNYYDSKDIKAKVE